MTQQFSFSIRKPVMLFTVFAALFISNFAGAAVRSDDATVPLQVSEDYYKQFTFNWTDSEGTVHQSDITEPATEYNHIVALLSKIYLDPMIPGYVRDATAEESAALTGAAHKTASTCNTRLTSLAPARHTIWIPSS